MPRWPHKLLLLAIGIAVLAVAAALVTARWLEQTLSAENVAARASAELGQDVRIRSLRVHFTPWLRVRLEGFTVGTDAAAEVVEIGPRLLPLLVGRAEPGRIEIEGARIRLTRSEGGGFRFGTGGGPGSSRAIELGHLPEIEVSEASIEFVDLDAGGEPVRTWLQLASVSLGPSLLTGEAELEGTVRVGPAGDGGELRVEATAGHDGTFDVSIEASRLDLASLRPYLERSWDLECSPVRRVCGRTFRWEPKHWRSAISISPPGAWRCRAESVYSIRSRSRPRLSISVTSEGGQTCQPAESCEIFLSASTRTRVR
ncbi:MAG: hypothetical protein JRH01_18940 [Deltaproteobacteria bacterium]|nr:hypothetical protein [Deltaproteobacteria bacterium]